MGDKSGEEMAKFRIADNPTRMTGKPEIAPFWRLR
jgi:hypothetical protein